MSAASQFVSRFNSLSSQFRRVSTNQQAIELAAQLCAVLGDVVGQVSQTLSDLDDRLKTADAQIADLECDRSEWLANRDSDDQMEPLQFPEPEYVELSFDELAINRAVWIDVDGEKKRVDIRELLFPARFGLRGSWAMVVATDSNGLPYTLDRSSKFYAQV